MPLIELYPAHAAHPEHQGSPPLPEDALVRALLWSLRQGPNQAELQHSHCTELCTPAFKQQMQRAVYDFSLFPTGVQQEVLQEVLGCPVDCLSQVEAVRRFVRAYFSLGVARSRSEHEAERPETDVTICCGHTSLSHQAVAFDLLGGEFALQLGFNPARRENWLLAGYQSIEEVMGVFLAHMTEVVRSVYLGESSVAILSGGAVRTDAESGERATLSEAESYYLVIREFILPTLFPNNLWAQHMILHRILLHPTARTTAENMLGVAVAEHVLEPPSAQVRASVITWAFKAKEVSTTYAAGVNLVRQQQGLPPVTFRINGVGDLANPAHRAAAVRDNERRGAQFLQAVQAGQDFRALSTNRETEYTHELFGVQEVSRLAAD